ncbi:MAG: hypothetical protein AABZ55_05050, partial [Bdellovibrionota bacterium]
MVRFKTDNINFAQKEVVGLKYQIPLQELITQISTRKLMSQKERKLLPEKNKIIDELIAKVEANDLEVGPTLEFTDNGLSVRNRLEFTVAGLKKKWRLLVSLDLKKDETGTIQAHNALIHHISVMVKHLGDTSNLILDPDLDSYYLMDVTLLALPRLQNHLNHLVDLLGLEASLDSVSVSGKAAVRSYFSLIKEGDI